MTDAMMSLRGLPERSADADLLRERIGIVAAPLSFERLRRRGEWPYKTRPLTSASIWSAHWPQPWWKPIDSWAARSSSVQWRARAV